MTHPFLPEIIPDVPEHVVPTGPSPLEERIGVVYCVRCGRAMHTIDGKAMKGASKPCIEVKISLRCSCSTRVATPLAELYACPVHGPEFPRRVTVVIVRRSHGPHYAKWYDPEDGIVRLGWTRRDCSDRHTFQPPDKDLDARCWCGLHTVAVPARTLLRGITYACCEACCKVAKRRFGVSEPVIAEYWVRIAERRRQRDDAEAFYDELLAEHQE